MIMYIYIYKYKYIYLYKLNQKCPVVFGIVVCVAENQSIESEIRCCWILVFFFPFLGERRQLIESNQKSFFFALSFCWEKIMVSNQRYVVFAFSFFLFGRKSDIH